MRIKLTYKLPIILSEGEDSGIVVTCPLIPGCISQGQTRDEAMRNIREAVDLCLDMQSQEGWSIPARYEVAEVTNAVV
ncbi:MAG: type II toxin-antitoxin system HicB family antitoxin [Myxococcota bacterium]